MNGLLLCSSKRGRTPFVVAENRIEIWSLEELCYYLYQNAYRITEEFFSEELVEYLREELELGTLADKLTALKKEEADFLEFILAVCQASNYYEQEEALRLVQDLQAFAMLGRAERLKLLADSCIQKRHYAQAVREYEAILALKYKEGYDDNFEGRLYHNMGIAYAKMLLYREAESCLRRAEKLLKEPDIKKDFLLLYYLADNTRKFEETAALFTEEERRELLERWESIRKNAKTENGRNEAVIEKWKQEYRLEMT